MSTRKRVLCTLAVATIVCLIAVQHIIASGTLAALESCSGGPNTVLTGGTKHSIVLRSDGTVWTWGDNTLGQLGDATVTGRITPTSVSGLQNVASIAAGINHNLALTTTGEVWAWGDNGFGQIGDGLGGIGSVAFTPKHLSALSDIVAIAAGYYHSLALQSDGTLWVWGRNNQGQLGLGYTCERVLTPQPLDAFSPLSQIVGGGYFSLVLDVKGQAWSWGQNNWGQLGDGSSQPSYIPQPVATITSAVALTAGNSHALALLSDGSVWSWGQNNWGQLGSPTPNNYSLTPIPVSSVEQAQNIVANGNFSMALDQSGILWSWGHNSVGQLGSGSDSTFHVMPQEILGLDQVTTIGAASTHGLAVTSSGLLWAWGHNGDGELGRCPYEVGVTVRQPLEVMPLEGGVLVGEVLLAQRIDHAGLRVEAKQDGQEVFFTLTDTEGQYALYLPLGVYQVSYNLPGWTTLTLTPLDITLGETVHIETYTFYFGDMNDDGVVDIVDLIWLSQQIGLSPTDDHYPTKADANQDGFINVLDLLHVIPNLGRTATLVE